ncbi:uncharacterized protein sgo2 isoform X2 [Hypomesus transpacificus]|uniref:uncharacterized protein sgo2 isoform X2 n=1 Tax=Hypomesus transpacificus TaxID=137520 RepID=UPI001F073FBA|nr:uncharacterized protein sgo2 isoform X2 [Hypomesus transpacificus]
MDGVAVPGKKLMSLKTSKQTSTVASKIKNKILNTSSFFKVSLKTNNKALALALVAQKEKSRQMEVENVHLQKQIEALYFDLAVRRHKHKKLVLILKDLHRSTLDNLEKALDLFSDYDAVPEPSNDLITPEAEDDDHQFQREAAQISLKPEQLISPLKQTSINQKPIVKENATFVNLTETQSKPTELKVKGKVSETESQADKSLSTQGGMLHKSSSFRTEVERWSQILSNPGLDSNPTVCLDNQMPSVVRTSDKPQPLSIMETSTPGYMPGTIKEPTLEPANIEVKIPLDTEMEMTLADSMVEIVTVETKPKKAWTDGGIKPRKKMKKLLSKDSEEVEKIGVKKSESAYIKDSLEMGTCFSSELPQSCSETLLTFDNISIRDEEEQQQAVTKVSADETQTLASRRKTHFTSRIPKHGRLARDTQKATQEESKPFDPRKTFVVSVQSKSQNTVSPNPFEDAFFMDGSSENKDSAKCVDKETQHKASKGKCRKTFEVKSQTDNCLKKKTFSVSNEVPYQRSKKTQILPLEVVHDKQMVKDTCVDLDLPSACVDNNDSQPESKDTHHSSCLNGIISHSTRQKSKRPTNSGQTNKGRSRETCVISVPGDNSLQNTCSDKQMGTPGTRYCFAGNESYTASDPSIEENLPVTDLDLNHCRVTGHENKQCPGGETQSSYKRPFRATEEPAEGLDSQQMDAIPPCEPASAIVQNPKKARKEKTGKSKMKVFLEGISVKEKKKKERSSTCGPSSSQNQENKGMACIEFAVPHADTLECMPAMEKSDILLVKSHKETMKSDQMEELFSVSAQSLKTKGDMQCSSKSQINTMHKPRCRGTYVIPFSNMDSTPNVNSRSQAEDDGLCVSEDAVHESLMDLLVDTRPPWETNDTITTEYELDCLDSSPLKTASRRVTVYEEETAKIITEPSPGRALKSVTNTNWMENENTGRTRRRGAAVSYKDPPINCKMRRGDKFTDTKFLNSPIFKNKKKRKQKKIECAPVN